MHRDDEATWIAEKKTYILYTMIIIPAALYYVQPLLENNSYIFLHIIFIFSRSFRGKYTCGQSWWQTRIRIPICPMTI